MCLPQLDGYLGSCVRKVLQSGIRAWIIPHTRWVVCFSCIHFGLICVSCIVRPCACCICMVWVMVTVRSPWEVDGIVVEFFTMSVWFIMYCLCTLVFTCGQLYNDVVVFSMHEVKVYVFDTVMHWWMDSSYNDGYMVRSLCVILLYSIMIMLYMYYVDLLIL